MYECLVLAGALQSVCRRATSSTPQGSPSEWPWPLVTGVLFGTKGDHDAMGLRAGMVPDAQGYLGIMTGRRPTEHGRRRSAAQRPATSPSAGQPQPARCSELHAAARTACALDAWLRAVGEPSTATGHDSTVLPQAISTFSSPTGLPGCCLHACFPSCVAWATQNRTVPEMSSARTVQGVPSTYRPPRGTVPQHGPGAAGTPPPRDPDLAFLAIARQAVTSSGFTKRDTLVGHAPGNCAHPGWRDRIIWKLGGLASPRLVSGRYSNLPLDNAWCERGKLGREAWEAIFSVRFDAARPVPRSDDEGLGHCRVAHWEHRVLDGAGRTWRGTATSTRSSRLARNGKGVQEQKQGRGVGGARTGNNAWSEANAEGTNKSCKRGKNFSFPPWLHLASVGRASRTDKVAWKTGLRRSRDFGDADGTCIGSVGRLGWEIFPPPALQGFRPHTHGAPAPRLEDAGARCLATGEQPGGVGWGGRRAPAQRLMVRNTVWDPSARLAMEGYLRTLRTEPLERTGTQPSQPSHTPGAGDHLDSHPHLSPIGSRPGVQRSGSLPCAPCPAEHCAALRCAMLRYRRGRHRWMPLVPGSSARWLLRRRASYHALGAIEHRPSDGVADASPGAATHACALPLVPGRSSNVPVRASSTGAASHPRRACAERAHASALVPQVPSGWSAWASERAGPASRAASSGTHRPATKPSAHQATAGRGRCAGLFSLPSAVPPALGSISACGGSARSAGPSTRPPGACNNLFFPLFCRAVQRRQGAVAPPSRGSSGPGGLPHWRGGGVVWCGHCGAGVTAVRASSGTFNLFDVGQAQRLGATGHARAVRLVPNTCASTSTEHSRLELLMVPPGNQDVRTRRRRWQGVGNVEGALHHVVFSTRCGGDILLRRPGGVFGVPDSAGPPREVDALPRRNTQQLPPRRDTYPSTLPGSAMRQTWKGGGTTTASPTKALLPEATAKSPGAATDRGPEPGKAGEAPTDSSAAVDPIAARDTALVLRPRPGVREAASVARSARSQPSWHRVALASPLLRSSSPRFLAHV
ncbi:hypothetical protein PCL_04882 [Purpureocillium lilacinum]|uniref:Uncharacterized protein n=1 Tax=Purpureocillium lilacinum TaxID=33203 RepID=A0A2U3DWY6_PURLI|nr:hypothetical protein PCL_04882 [Purpureocillium lilacinum]